MARLAGFLFICWFASSELPGWNLKLAPRWRLRIEEERGRHSRRVGGRGKKLEDFHSRLTWAALREYIATLPTGVFKACIEVFVGLALGLVRHPEGLDTTWLSQSCILNSGPTVGT